MLCIVAVTSCGALAECRLHKNGKHFFFFYQWLDVKSRWSFHGKSVWCLGVCQGTVMNVTHMPRNSENGYEPGKDIWSELLS